MTLLCCGNPLKTDICLLCKGTFDYTVHMAISVRWENKTLCESEAQDERKLIEEIYFYCGIYFSSQKSVNAL